MNEETNIVEALDFRSHKNVLNKKNIDDPLY